MGIVLDLLTGLLPEAAPGVPLSIAGAATALSVAGEGSSAVFAGVGGGACSLAVPGADVSDLAVEALASFGAREDAGGVGVGPDDLTEAEAADTSGLALSLFEVRPVVGWSGEAAEGGGVRSGSDSIVSAEGSCSTRAVSSS